MRQEKERERASQMTGHLLQRKTNRPGEQATAWIHLGSISGIAEREACALGLQKARPAFLAACSLASHHGMAEGWVVPTRRPLQGSLDGRGCFA